MDLKRLRVLTIVAPLAFLLGLEGVGILVLRPTLDNNSVLRLAITFAVLAVAVVPFSYWVFAIIERQQRALEERYAELGAVHQQVAQHNRQLDAVNIENARLYQEARSSRDRLQAWNDQLEAIVAERTRQIERSSRELTTRILQAQEDERKRIARELHDDTAQSLSSMLITLDMLAPRIPAEDALLNSGFERVVGLAKRTLDEVRDLSHSLRPAILDDFGLVAALRWFADEFVQTYGFPAEIVAEPVPNRRLSPDMELALFRIGQEALTNTGKYAHAKQARLTLSFPDESAQLIVEDDGKGFVLGELASPSRQGGFGLYGMRERAELLHGTLTIETTPGKGTRTTVRLPLRTPVRDPVPLAATSWHGAESC